MRARGCALAVLVALATFAVPASAAGVSAGFTDTFMVVAPGDTFTLSLQVLEAGDPFNAFDASIRFDPTRLEFVPTTPASAQRGAVMTGACANTFHLFTPAPDSLRITLSLLCNGVTVTGPGEIYHVRFRALATLGPTAVELGPFTRFFNAGFAVNPLTKRGVTVQIGVPTGVGPGGPAGWSAPWPNPSRGRGAIALRMPAPGEARLELVDLAGRVRLRQSSVLGAGEQRLEWNAGDLEPGLYFVRVRSHDGPAVVRRWTVIH